MKKIPQKIIWIVLDETGEGYSFGTRREAKEFIIGHSCWELHGPFKYVRGYD
jgi:hypothetical protein